MSSVKKNFVYNLIYQLLLLVFPLITVPYVSRVLGTDGVGIYSYTYSIISYFMLITLLGIENHGNRSIAKARDDKEKLSKTFFSIYSIQFISGILMILIYSCYMIFINKQFTSVAWAQILYLISALVDVNWFFFGLEEFKITITRSTIVKVLTLILIFCFVKNTNDVLLYTLIMAGSTLLSQLLIIPFLINRIKFVKIHIKDITQHLKYVLILFIPVVAKSIYRVMDKIMLGMMSSVTHVGLYEQADKIILVPCAVINALGVVMLPRISNLVANNKKDAVLKYIEKSIKFVMFLSFPMCLGMIAVADNFVPLFLGPSFNGSIILVKFMSITMLFLSFANVLRTQFLIPYEKDNIYVISIVLAAVVNFICNIIFIPKLASTGAMIGTIAAEFMVMFIQMIGLRKHLPIKQYLIDTIEFMIKALIMFVLIMAIGYIQLNSVLLIGLQIITGVMIYSALNYKYILSLLNIKK